MLDLVAKVFPGSDFVDVDGEKDGIFLVGVDLSEGNALFDGIVHGAPFLAKL
jgi:hypothetical protein